MLLTQKKRFRLHLTRGKTIDLWKARSLLQDNRRYNGINALSQIGTNFLIQPRVDVLCQMAYRNRWKQG